MHNEFEHVNKILINSLKKKTKNKKQKTKKKKKTSITQRKM